MARQRQVFPRDELAHLWAHRTQDSARDSGGSFYFTGATIYSYGSHYVIAHWLDDGRLLWNRDGYSNTTAKHRSHTWDAIPISLKGTDRIIHVPGLSQNDIYALRNPVDKAETFNAKARVLLSRAGDALAKANRARRLREWHITDAGSLLRDARALFMLAGSKKNAANVPTIPENPDKDTIAALVRQLKGAEYIAQATQRIERASQMIGFATACDAGMLNPDRMSHHTIGDMPNGGNPWEGASVACRVMHQVSAARHLLSAARADMKAAGKTSTVLANLARRADALAAKHEAQARADMETDALNEVRYLASEVSAQLARFMHTRKTLAHPNVGYVVYGSQWKRLETAMRALPHDKQPADVKTLMLRVERLRTGRALQFAVVYAQENLSNAQEHDERVTGDAELVRALANYQRYRAASEYWTKQVFSARQDLAAHNAAWDARAAVRNAEKINAWRRGETVRLPSDVPTMARIMGDEVETSRGARVPLEHACRLARLARVAIRKGGQSWPENAGPMVGHFRVNSINADGSAVIGCHEFSAEEGTRALAMLAACPACSEVTEEVKA